MLIALIMRLWWLSLTFALKLPVRAAIFFICSIFAIPVPGFLGVPYTFAEKSEQTGVYMHKM